MSVPDGQLGMIASMVEDMIATSTNHKHEYVLLVFDPEASKCDFVSSVPPPEAILNIVEWMQGMMKAGTWTEVNETEH